MSARQPSRRQAPAPTGFLASVRRRLSAPPRRDEPARIATAFAVATAVLAVVPFINASPSEGVTGRAPDFTIDRTTGGTYALSNDLGVRPLLVEFMHPDCGHCISMGPTLRSAHDEFGSRVRFVTVAVRLSGFAEPTIATVSAFASEHGHTWTYGVDQGTTALRAYQLSGTPTFVFISSNGTIARTWPGEMSIDSMRAQLGAIAGG